MGSAVKTTYKYRCGSGIGQWAAAGRVEALRCLKQTPRTNTALKTVPVRAQKEVKSILEKSKWSTVWRKGMKMGRTATVPVNPFQLGKERPHLLSPL